MEFKNPYQYNDTRQSAGESEETPKILIVEDEPLVAWSLSSSLQKAGFIVSVVDTGEKALELLNSNRCDLLITDLKLPRIDGYEVASSAKRAHPRVVVLIMSALEDDIPTPASFNVQIDGFIEKPFDLKDVTLRIRKLVGTSGAIS